MFHTVSPEQIDYLILGHLTVDLTPSGPTLGGSAAYSALTAQALGLRVGIVTCWANEISLSSLGNVSILASPAEHATTFENIYTAQGRIQYVRHQAPKIDLSLVPEHWKKASILHLAPVMQELDAIPPAGFSPTLLALTPQGWMRTLDEAGRVYPCQWKDAASALPLAGATILSVEDVGHNEELIENMAQQSRLLVVTEGAAGCRVFWHGDSRRFRAPQVQEVDATGAGDIFSTSFFVRLFQTRDPWEAARFATQIASLSITRPGIHGVPTQAEIQKSLMEILQ